MKQKSFIIAALLFAGITHSYAQVVIKNGGDKIEVKGKEVKISSDGASSQQTAGSITITGSGKEETYDGTGKNVTISGSKNRIRITGYPSTITVSGSNNDVYADGAKTITVAGSNNLIAYYNLINNQKPAITISGVKNSVIKRSM